MTLRVDLHIHTDRSIDGRHSLERMAAAAKQAGLDAIAITDHDQCTPLPPELEGVLLIPACEISTQVGHITGLFLDRPVAFDTLCKDGRPTGQAAVEEIHRCGGLAVAAHPFQKPGVDGSRLPPGLDAVEGVNARANFKVSDANAKARQWAMDHHLPAVGGSDSHGFQEVGNGYTEVDCPEKNLSALQEAITAGRCRPVLRRHTTHREKGLSQLAKARKRGGVLRTGKALAYVVFCLYRDLLHAPKEE